MGEQSNMLRCVRNLHKENIRWLIPGVSKDVSYGSNMFSPEALGGHRGPTISTIELLRIIEFP
jgi:hypothetical protein